MDYLDPKKQRRHRLTLWIGYAMVSIGIAVSCLILLWQADGYGVQNGKIVQDGMIFLSSQPNPASIYINGVLNSAKTNARLSIPSGAYTIKLSAPGYRAWQHVVSILGDQVVHYDYPLLFPTKLTTKEVADYTSAPAFATQSPSQKYLVVASTTDFSTFYMYNLSSPTTPPVTLTLPAGIITAATTTQSWQVVGWADDNQHLLLDHLYDGTQEFIEIDTANMSQSINLNHTFNVTPTSVSLDNLKYNQFYFYDASDDTLSQAVIGGALTTVLTNAVAYKSYQSNTIIYATTTGAPSGEVAIELENNGTTYFVRYLPVAQTYLLDMAGYNGSSYAVVGDSSENFVYIYSNPVAQATAAPKAKILPFRAMSITAPNYESFAPTAQFILAENGTSFAVYDIYNDLMYRYNTPMALDSPQLHAQWMDGDRLIYVSGGKLSVADYDDTNRQDLNSALPQYETFFAPDYHSYFNLAPDGTQVQLRQTSLLAS